MALIPPRYRSVALLVTIIALIGLFTHIHQTNEPFRHHVQSIFTQRIRKGENGQTWYQSWGWKPAVTVNLAERMEEVAGKAGTTGDVVEASRERIIGLQAICRRDGDRWEREYGYVLGSSDLVSKSDGLIPWYSRANLRMARSYEGSHARLKQVIRKALRGEELVLSAIGGSGKSCALFRPLKYLWATSTIQSPVDMASGRMRFGFLSLENGLSNSCSRIAMTA